MRTIGWLSVVVLVLVLFIGVESISPREQLYNFENGLSAFSSVDGELTVATTTTEGIPTHRFSHVAKAKISSKGSVAQVTKAITGSGSGVYSAYVFFPSSYVVPTNGAVVFGWKDGSDLTWWVSVVTLATAQSLCAADEDCNATLTNVVDASSAAGKAPVAIVSSKGTVGIRGVAYTAIPQGRWFELRADVQADVRITFKVDGHAFTTATNSEYSISPKTFVVGNNADDVASPIYVEYIRYAPYLLVDDDSSSEPIKNDVKPAVSFTVAQLMSAINKQRTSNKLKVSDDLMKVAKEHARYMAVKGKADTNPYVATRPVVRQNYFPFGALYENVAVVSRSTSAAAVVSTWLFHQAQRDHMLSTKVSEFGCAIVYGSVGRYFVSCEFGSPKKSLTTRSILSTTSDELSGLDSVASNEMSPASSGSQSESDDVSYGASNEDDVENSNIDNYAFKNVFAQDDGVNADKVVDQYDDNEFDLIPDETGFGVHVACSNVDCNSDDTKQWNPIKCTNVRRCNTTTTTTCVADATITCAASKQTCGHVFDGCNQISCGDCASGQTCQLGQCVAAACAGGCPNNAKCVQGACVCPLGSTLLHGECHITSVLSLTPSDQLTSYVFSGSADKWTLSYDDSDAKVTQAADGSVTDAATNDAVSAGFYSGVEYNGNAQSRALWKNTNAITGTVLVVSAQILISATSTEAGLVFRAKDVNNYNFFSYSPSTKVLTFGIVVNGKTTKSQKVGTADLSGWQEFSVVLRGNTNELFVGENRYPASNYVVSDDTKTNTGFVGLVANGDVTFGDLKFRTRAIMHIQSPCPTSDVPTAINKFSWALKVRPDQLKFKCITKPTKKRDLTAEEFIEISVEGDGDYVADSLVEDTATYSAADPAFADSFVVESVEAVPDVAVDATAFEIAAATAALSAGAIAGIAIGGAAVVGAGAVGGAVVVKKRRAAKKVNKKVAVPETEMETKSEKPKGAGANVFDLDPNNHVSITARSQTKQDWV